jgi:hypothetical protein
VVITDIGLQLQQPPTSALRQLVTLARHHPCCRRQSVKQDRLAIGTSRLWNQSCKGVDDCRKQFALWRRRVEHVDISRPLRGAAEQAQEPFIRSMGLVNRFEHLQRALAWKVAAINQLDERDRDLLLMRLSA